MAKAPLISETRPTVELGTCCEPMCGKPGEVRHTERNYTYDFCKLHHHKFLQARIMAAMNDCGAALDLVNKHYMPWFNRKECSDSTTDAYKDVQKSIDILRRNLIDDYRIHEEAIRSIRKSDSPLP